MNRLGTDELRFLWRELDRTLTPKQRQLLTVGAARPEHFTSAQREILQKAEAHLKGLTPEQARRLGIMDTFAEGYEKGQKFGTALVLGGIVLFVLVFLAVLLSR
jgi:hypothetical protein